MHGTGGQSGKGYNNYLKHVTSFRQVANVGSRISEIKFP
jgi:hypothetical protein